MPTPRTVTETLTGYYRYYLSQIECFVILIKCSLCFLFCLACGGNHLISSSVEQNINSYGC